jgi:hypothetical protein
MLHSWIGILMHLSTSEALLQHLIVFEWNILKCKFICLWHYFHLEDEKGKVAPVLKWQTLNHKNLWGIGCIDPCFLSLGTRWRWVVSFVSLSLYPMERTSGTHWIGGWVGPRAGLDDMEWLNTSFNMAAIWLKMF